MFLNYTEVGCLMVRAVGLLQSMNNWITECFDAFGWEVGRAFDFLKVFHQQKFDFGELHNLNSLSNWTTGQLNKSQKQWYRHPSV